jgi:hypothetical protein
MDILVDFNSLGIKLVSDSLWTKLTDYSIDNVIGNGERRMLATHIFQHSL